MAMNQRGVRQKTVRGHQHVVNYSLKAAVNKWGEKASSAAKDEMQQLLDRKVFHPIRTESITPEERKKVLESLLFVIEKRDGRIKARHCANGSPQRAWIPAENASSPTVSTESVLLTAIIDAEEGRDVMTSDVPNAFVQTEHPLRDEDGARTIMRIRALLVDILCELDPSYTEFVTTERNQSTLYVHITEAIYGLMVAAILWYKKFRASIEKIDSK